MQKKLAYALMAIAFLVVLAACGGGNNDSSGAEPSESLVASQEVVITASSWQFDKTEYKIPKDTPVRITVDNADGAHGIEIPDAKLKIRGGKSKVVTLAAGTYEFHCNIQCGAGHGKMVAKLIVE